MVQRPGASILGGSTINLAVESRTEGGWSVVDVRGEVDLHTAPKLREHLYGLVEQGNSRIVLNLEPLDFMDSTGLAVLVAALKRVKSNDGELVLAGPQDPVRKVLSITGLDKVFLTHASLTEALRE